MSSYSRNSRKSIRALQIAVAVAALTGSAAYAEEPGHFELTAFSNGPAGKALTSGDYNTALVQLQHARTFEPDTSSTNRCVAYAVTRRTAEASAACDTAVRQAQMELASLPVSMQWARADYRDYLALAYSNRAVLKWMLNDTRAAQSDLKKAAAISPKATFVARNETALESHAKFARVSLR